MRVIRTLSAMGIRSAAVFSDADAGARHVAEADVAVAIGPAPARQSYLDIDAVVAAARRTGAQAVHPGYGFLSENGEFAAAPAVGRNRVHRAAGRGAAHHGRQDRGEGCCVGVRRSGRGPALARPGLTDEDLIAAADDVGYPVLVKPSAGGGGKGMRVFWRTIRGPARGAGRCAARIRGGIGDDTLFLERFDIKPPPR